MLVKSLLALLEILFLEELPEFDGIDGSYTLTRNGWKRPEIVRIASIFANSMSVLPSYCPTFKNDKNRTLTMNEPRNYRDEAARIRAIAADRDGGEVKAQLMKIADLYEHLADIAEKQKEP